MMDAEQGACNKRIHPIKPLFSFYKSFHYWLFGFDKKNFAVNPVVAKTYPRL